MIVLDTSVISAFAEIGRFPLLKEILSRLENKAIIPHTVENEIIFPEAISVLKEKGGWIDIEKVQDFEKYLFMLHDGEAGVIALAKKHGWIAALDDLDARKIAKKEHVKITGTLGLQIVTFLHFIKHISLIFFPGKRKFFHVWSIHKFALNAG